MRPIPLPARIWPSTASNVVVEPSPVTFHVAASGILALSASASVFASVSSGVLAGTPRVAAIKSVVASKAG